MKKSVVCIVQDRVKAENVVTQLKAAGFADNDLSVLFPDKQGTRDFAHEHNTKAPEGAVAGVGAGGALGGTVGLLAGIGALAIPGLGPFIAAGPLVAALSGAAVGAAAGGLTGALIGMGIPEIEAKRYEGKVKGGNLLIAVHAEDAERRKVAERVFKDVNAEDISTVTEASVPR
jgi:outer membrane lipoprotein SlyB